MKQIVWLLLTLIAMPIKAHKDDSYRNFWQPLYKKSRLNYCFYSKPHQCGRTVADHYCQQMGYQKSNQAIVAYNADKSRYLDNNLLCKGITCQSFKKIRCVKKITHSAGASWYYRYKKFNYPSFHQRRIAWCYQPGKQCGAKAAQSFCRKMGYLKATRQQIDNNVAVTQYLANQKLCIHQACQGFRTIICYR